MKTRFVILVCFISIAQISLASDWREFRGPNGNGVSSQTGLPLHWNETKNIKWRCAVPGKGYSSPVVANGKVWLTTAVEHEATDQQRDEILKDVEVKKRKQRAVAGKIELKAICVDLKMGQLERTISLTDLVNPDPIHKFNSFSSPTPCIDGDRIYCHFGTYGTWCISTTTGKVLWHRRFALVHNVGPGSSPIIHNDLLVLVCDGVDVQYVIALNRMDGRTVWKTDRPPMRAPSGDQKKAYSTPLVIDHEGKTQLVIPTSQWIVSYVPETGEEIWRADHGKGFSLVPRPVFGHGMVYFFTGFGKPELWAVRVDGKGDVSRTHVAWKVTRSTSSKPSPLLVGDEVYVLADLGIVSCIDAKTGDVHWRERVKGSYSSSPVFADGKIFICNQDGRTTVLQPEREFKVLAENDLDSALMASPAIVDGSILLRTQTSLYRVGE